MSASPCLRRRAFGRRGFMRSVAAFACGGAAFAAPGADRVLDERETQFGRLVVLERDRRRYLAYRGAFDTRLMYESVLDLDRPHELAAPYTRLMMLGAVYAEPYARMAQIGVGAGNMTGYALRTFPEAQVHAVDVDAQTLELGAKHFGLAPHPRLSLHIADGRAWLAAREDRFDVIMLDAYDDRSIPAALADAGFFALVAARLNPGGVAMQNLYLPQVDAGRIVGALRASFAQADVYRVGSSAVLAAYQGEARPLQRLMQRARVLDAALRPAHPLAELLRHRVAAL